ncbi:hypothetical protein SEA_SHAM_118 [Streptomyces phage Sham]|nr:hypothetical protein SEA_SHAM_118 [Streptomyces phage Sham]
MAFLDKIYYKAKSRIEAESWINSTGKKRYPEIAFTWKRSGNEWLVVKK